MINLDSTTRVQAFLGGAITTREINFFVTYADRVTATGVTSLAVTVVSKSSGTSDVDICSAPAAGTIRSVLGIIVANVDTAAVECTIQLEDGSDWPFTPFTISANRMAQFTKEGQWVEYSAGGGGGDALTTNPLSQFAATTSAQLRGVLSDETGTGAAVFATSPTLVTPALGTPSSGTLTNCTGLPIAGGGTGGTTAATARTALGAANTTFSWEWVWGPRVHRATAGTLSGADSNLSDNTDMDGTITGVNCADAARTDCFFQFTVPTEIDVSQAITAIVYYRIGAAGTGAAVEIEMTARAIADNEVNVSGGTLFTVGGGACIKSVNTYASGDLVVHSIGEVFGAASLSAQELVHGCFFRDAQAGNADDTFANTIMLAAVRFTGTRLTT